MPYEWVPAFLAALSASPNIAAACQAAGIARQTAYNHRKADPGFALAWDDALDTSTDALVGAMYRRAVEGCDEPVFYEGGVCGYKRHYSDTLAMFLARAHRPAVYGDSSKVDLAVSGEAPSRTVFLIPHNGRDELPPGALTERYAPGDR